MKIKITKKQFEDAVKPKETESSEEESEEKKNLKDTIGAIEKEYQTSPSRTYGDVTVPNTVEKTYEMPSSEETIKKAESEISPLYNAKIQSITSENTMAQQNIEDEKDELFKRAEESLNELKRTYDGARENTSNEAIKRGLARSSIVLNQLNDIERGHIDATAGILTQRDGEIANLKKELDNLKVKLLNDTNILNEERAKEINERVEDLLDKYQKEEKEVLEYNNKVRKEKADTLAKLKEAGIATDETESKEYVKMIADKTRAFYSYYYSLGENAVAEMEKDRKYIEENIGEKGYESLMRYFR